MIGDAQFVHGLDHRTGMFGRYRRVDAVAEVEYVPGSLTIAGEDLADRASDGIRRGVQGARIEVALQRHTVTDPVTRVADVDGAASTRWLLPQS